MEHVEIVINNDDAESDVVHKHAHISGDPLEIIESPTQAETQFSANNSETNNDSAADIGDTQSNGKR